MLLTNRTVAKGLSVTLVTRWPLDSQTTTPFAQFNIYMFFVSKNTIIGSETELFKKLGHFGFLKVRSHLVLGTLVLSPLNTIVVI